MSNSYTDENGSTYWMNDAGQFHNKDGPAIITASNIKCWYQNGKRHRTDGPALEFISGYQEWWINGKCYEDSKLFQNAANLSNEDMLVIILRYGNII